MAYNTDSSGLLYIRGATNTFFWLQGERQILRKEQTLIIILVSCNKKIHLVTYPYLLNSYLSHKINKLM